jgi:type I restriction enzyme R subunit
MKLVARYAQFKAVHRITRRMLTGIPGTPARRDERGGVVWHTQGSGKSYTMAFLIRKMRTTRGLSDFKVVVAVDRVDLRTQLSDSLALAGETVYVAGGVLHARELLSDEVPNVVLIMMQHAQRDDDATSAAEREPERLGDDVVEDRVGFPELTRSQRIVVIADEAHRTQQGWLHSRLRRGLPGAAWIGFTGTPLTREDKRRRLTTGIFGDFFDTYTLRESANDGATVPIRYEQRRSEQFIVDRVALDAEYEREVGGTPEDREAEQRKLTTRQILESEDLIAAKARDMLRHWVSTVLPNGFKAQVAAATRRAAVRYRAALRQARDDLVAELVGYRTAKDQDLESARNHPDRDFLDAALPFEPLLRIVDFVPVISPGERRDPQTGEIRRDPPDWAEWTAENAHRTHVDRFKERLPAPETIGIEASPSGTIGPEPWATIEPPYEPSSRGVGPWDQTPVQPDNNMNYQEQGPGTVAGPVPIGFVIVQSMLLTGFDAPVEQVLYLDRPIRDVELLQAIARVNRPARLKMVGLVVDYAGVSRHLDAALAIYDEEDIRGAKTFLDEDDVPRLREARDAVRNFLSAHGIGSLVDVGGEVDKLLITLSDQYLRNEFDDLVNEFCTYLDRVLPRPEALDYENDAREFGTAQYRIRRLFRDTRSGGLDPYSYGAKVRRLIDEHLRAIGIAQRIPPVDVTAADFREQVAALDSSRLRAMEMEHALRRHFTEHQASDPVYYEQLSDRLDRLLQQLRDDSERLAAALDELVNEVREWETATDASNLDPRTERPIRSILERAYAESMAEYPDRVPAVPGERFDALSRQVAIEIRREVSPPHFMTSVVLQERLRRKVYGLLSDTDMYTRLGAGRAAQDILALARANRDFYLRAG